VSGGWLTAPGDGPVDPGDPVVPLTSLQEGTELATIADMRDLRDSVVVLGNRPAITTTQTLTNSVQPRQEKTNRDKRFSDSSTTAGPHRV
jgi:hypothetical protein